MYLTTYQFHSTQSLDVLESWLMNLKQRVIEPSIEFVYGKGKRKTVHQRQVEALEDYIKKRPVKTRLSCPHWRGSGVYCACRHLCSANDITTLIPFLTFMSSRLSQTYECVIADAGYESEENDDYLKENHQKGFIKPLNDEA